MKFIPKIAVASLASFSLIVPAMAEVSQPINLSSSEASISNNTFGNSDFSYAFGDDQDLQVMSISKQEMEDTEGAVAPLVAVGVMTGSRFIVQRWVTQRVAQNMVRRGATNIMAPNRSIAKRIAGNKPIREFHPGAGSRYTHYHPNPRNGSHVWYGRPR